MAEQLLAVGSVDDQEEVVVVHAVDDDVVAHAALLVAHEGVAALSGDHVVDLAGAEALEELA